MAQRASGRVLFITWDGPQQPYLKSLFLPALRGIAATGRPVSVLQLSWGGQPQLGPADLGPISLRSLSIPRRGFPFSYGPTIARAVLEVLRLTASGDVLLPRSHLPAAIALLARRARPSLRVVWDMDGFMPDERVEFGGWSPRGPMYRALRSVEALAASSFDGLLVRTQAARRLLMDRYGEGVATRVHVVPNGRDPDSFTPGTPEQRRLLRAGLRIPDGCLLVVTSGSLGPQYLPDKMVEVCRVLLTLHRDAHWLMMTSMKEEAERLVRSFGPLRERVRIHTVEPASVGNHLAACDVGLALRVSGPSQAGVCPLKVAEFLLCGVPVVATTGVGDLDLQLAAQPAALLIDAGHGNPGEVAASWLAQWYPGRREPMREGARALGQRHFSLGASVSGYVSSLP